MGQALRLPLLAVWARIVRVNGCSMQNCEDVESALYAAIELLRTHVRWRPGKDVVHLRKRQRLGHLPVGATMESYNELIQGLVSSRQNLVYAYRFRRKLYGVVTGKWDEREWLAIFTAAGVMETAFPPDDVQFYVRQNDMRLLGTVGEIVG